MSMTICGFTPKIPTCVVNNPKKSVAITAVAATAIATTIAFFASASVHTAILGFLLLTPIGFYIFCTLALIAVIAFYTLAVIAAIYLAVKCVQHCRKHITEEASKPDSLVRPLELADELDVDPLDVELTPKSKKET